MTLDRIDREAMRQLLHPRWALTSKPLEEERWWQEWKQLRALIEHTVKLEIRPK